MTYLVNWDFNVGDTVRHPPTNRIGKVVARGHLMPRLNDFRESTSDTYLVDQNWMVAGYVAGCKVEFDDKSTQLFAETALFPHP